MLLKCHQFRLGQNRYSHSSVGGLDTGQHQPSCLSSLSSYSPSSPYLRPPPPLNTPSLTRVLISSLNDLDPVGLDSRNRKKYRLDQNQRDNKGDGEFCVWKSSQTVIFFADKPDLQ